MSPTADEALSASFMSWIEQDCYLAALVAASLSSPSPENPAQDIDVPGSRVEAVGRVIRRGPMKSSSTPPATRRRGRKRVRGSGPGSTREHIRRGASGRATDRCTCGPETETSAGLAPAGGRTHIG